MICVCLYEKEWSLFKGLDCYVSIAKYDNVKVEIPATFSMSK